MAITLTAINNIPVNPLSELVTIDDYTKDRAIFSYGDNSFNITYNELDIMNIHGLVTVNNGYSYKHGVMGVDLHQPSWGEAGRDGTLTEAIIQYIIENTESWVAND